MAESSVSVTPATNNDLSDSPAAVAAHARKLLGEGQIQIVRTLVDRALQNYPANNELLRLKRVIEPGKVVRHPGLRYSNRQAEFDWIARNRDQYQGQWVALIGDQLIAAEEDAKILLKKLKQQNPSETPLVHRIVRT